MTEHGIRTSRRRARRRGAAAAPSNGGAAVHIAVGPGGPKVLDEAAVLALDKPSEKRQVEVPLTSLGRTIHVSSESRGAGRPPNEAIIATSR